MGGVGWAAMYCSGLRWMSGARRAIGYGHALNTYDTRSISRPTTRTASPVRA